MFEVVTELEQRFLSRFAEAGRDIERDFPPARARSYSAPVGSATDAQGHFVALECWLPGIPIDQPDSVGLFIGVWHLTTNPELYEAYVAWDNGRSELDVLPSPIPYSPSAITALSDRLADLFAALRMAVERGGPAVW